MRISWFGCIYFSLICISLLFAASRNKGFKGVMKTLRKKIRKQTDGQTQFDLHIWLNQKARQLVAQATCGLFSFVASNWAQVTRTGQIGTDQISSRVRRQTFSSAYNVIKKEKTKQNKIISCIEISSSGFVLMPFRLDPLD